MPTTPVATYFAEKTRINPDQLTNNSPNRKLIREAARSLGEELNEVLYNAVVQLNGNRALAGPGLTPQQLRFMSNLAGTAARKDGIAAQDREVLKNFEGGAKRYASHLDESRDSGREDQDMVSSIINKQERGATPYGTKSVPRHTLNRHGSKNYEILAWMSQDEVNRVESRFPGTNGLFSIQAQRERTRHWNNKSFTEYKITLGAGAFGVARLARRIRDDQYMLFKKVHPQDIGLKPALTPMWRTVNDGALSGVSAVHDTFMAHSTRGGGEVHTEKSAYTLMELGVIDAHKFLAVFHIMSFALNETNRNNEVANMFLNTMIASENPLQSYLNSIRLRDNPCMDAEKVRRFRNTLAHQMLKAVEQLHQADRAHNDLKPDNFVFAHENGQLQLKMIDFDMSASVSQTLAKARNAYCKAFTAPQASAAKVNNNPDLNDAYSLGCTFRLLSGEPFKALQIQYDATRGKITDTRGKPLKPVENRRQIEARFSKTPELTTVLDLANLLSHPHCRKRYTVKEALRSPLFTQPSNLLSASEFTEMAAKIVRHGAMLPEKLVKGYWGFNEFDKLIHNAETSERLYGPMASWLVNQDEKLVTAQYAASRSEKQLRKDQNAVKRQVRIGKVTAAGRRTARQLNPMHHLKSPETRENDYKINTPK